MNFRRSFASVFLAAIFMTVVLSSALAQGKAATVKGYVLDSACAFMKNLKKPVSTECALAAQGPAPLW